ncbi:unnamed protein product [Musa acuminata var. zebrina]
MGDFSAPSFSLGLDLDLADLPTEGEEEEEEQERSPLPNPLSGIESPNLELFRDQRLEEREAIGPGIALDPEPIWGTPLPALKRLRRGPPPPRCRSNSLVAHSSLDDGGGELRDDSILLDDDIEEFSSPENNPSRDKSSSVRNHIAGSFSKFSLQNHGVLTGQSTTKLMVPKISRPFDVLPSAVSHEICNKKVFQNLSTPIRKIHLLSSDSDDSASEDKYKYKNKVDASKLRHQNLITENEQQRSLKYRKHLEDSFWKDFNPINNINLATPALDEFCEEYIKSKKDPRPGQHREEDLTFCSSRVSGTKALADEIEGSHRQISISRNTKPQCNLTNPEPPAFQYFYHDDMRIQTLVKRRLCYFVPLGAELHGAEKQPGAENLNYMSQFSTTDVQSRACKTNKQGLNRSFRKGKRPKDASPKKSSDATGDWMTPKNCTAIPKDAGKRRVHASGHQSGHWFTDQNGRKAYVTKNGQELTGRVAYRQYKKDSGGFRKPRKKSAAKKKTK